MKKKIAVLCCCAAAGCLLGACDTKLDVEENTIALQKNGKVLEAAVESFDQSYYDSAELDTYIQNAVDAYTQANGKDTVSVTESKVEEKTAYLTLKYSDVDTFSDFTGMECFAGSVVQAQSAGYDFDLDFYEVTDGTAGEETVSGDKVLEDDDLNVFIVKGNSDLIVPGKIAYVSAQGTEVTSEKQVNVQQKEQDTDEAILVYVLYK